MGGYCSDPRNDSGFDWSLENRKEKKKEKMYFGSFIKKIRASILWVSGQGGF